MEFAIQIDFSDRAAALLSSLVDVLRTAQTLPIPASPPAPQLAPASAPQPETATAAAPPKTATPHPKPEALPAPDAKDASPQDAPADDHGITLETLRAELRGLPTETAKGLIRRFGAEALSKVEKASYPALLEAARKAKE